jgi:GntR family transcriptional regulator
MNPNTVARAYRELEHEGVIELKHGLGAFVAESMVARTKIMRKAQAIVQSAIERLASLRLSEDEIRRLVENDLALLRSSKVSERTNE